MNPRYGFYGPKDWRGPRSSYFARGGVKFAILELLKEKPRHGYDIIREMEERSGGMYSPSPGVIYPTLQALEDQDYIRSAEQDGKRVYSITDAGRAYLEGHQEQARAGRDAKYHRGGAGRGDKARGRQEAGGAGASAEATGKGWTWARCGGEGGAGAGPGAGAGADAGTAGGAGAWGAWFTSCEGPELMRELKWLFGDFAGAIQRTLGDPQKMKEIRVVLREAKQKIDEIVMR